MDKLEEFLGDAEHFELADGNTVDITEASAAHNAMKAEIASLRAELAATDQKWQDAVAELVGVDMILTERKGAASQGAEKIARLERCLNFFASVIMSGESWTETCEREYRAAIACRPQREKS